MMPSGLGTMDEIYGILKDDEIASRIARMGGSATPAAGEMSQAEDRCHRIGQKNAVLVQHLVLSGSLDAYMSRKVIFKQEIIERAVDDSSLSDEIRELLK